MNELLIVKSITQIHQLLRIEKPKHPLISIYKHTPSMNAGFEGVRYTGALYYISMKDGQFTATNFHQYPLASLMDTPEIEIVMLEGLDKPLGVGEPPIAPIAPAIANAIFDLTGQRLRQLPLQKELSQA